MSDLLTNLKEQRDERVQDLHLDLPVPTWNSTLVARFDVMDRKKVEKFSKQKRTIEADQDFVIQATRELYAYDPDKQAEGMRMEGNDDYVRIETVDGAPIKFDSVLAEKFGETALSTGREVLMYCVKDNAIAVGGLAGKLIQWMQNTDSEVADSLAGE
jgi:hypothetical protein